MNGIRLVVTALVGLGAAGCGGSGSDETSAPVKAVAAVREVSASSTREAAPKQGELLGFEDAADLVFVGTDFFRPQVDAARAHSGKASLMVGRGVRRVEVKLSSLLRG